jgi:hypothetical protein
VIRRVAALLSLVPLAALAAGCGTSSSQKSRLELRAYIHAVEREDREYERIRSEAFGLVSAATQVPAGDAWVRAARLLEQDRVAVARLGPRNHHIHSPDKLADRHEDLGRSYGLVAVYIGGIEGALRGKDTAGLKRAVVGGPNAVRMAKLRSGWRRAVTGYAKTLGEPVPVWVTHIGLPG